MIDLQKVEGFEWDKGNARKNEKHGITQAEAEQIFANDPLLVLQDEKHSRDEQRFHALGMTNERRLLHVTFTLRHSGTKIRVISARNMHFKERRAYDQEA